MVASTPPQTAELELVVEGEGLVDGVFRISSLSRYGRMGSTEPVELSNNTVNIAENQSGLLKPVLNQWYQSSGQGSLGDITFLNVFDEVTLYSYDASNIVNLPMYENPFQAHGYGFIV